MPLHRTRSAPAGDSVLREHAARGRLADTVADAASAAGLRPAAYDMVWPLVWARHTRRLESAKGHRRCASSVGRLESACLDGFQDDVEAVVDYLFRHARGPIHCLEGWITSRIPAAVVDGNRRRRGRRGALQRVRVPRWLAIRLDDDPWLIALAARVIEWVGVPSTAGLEVWPIEAWADLCARITGDREASHPGRVADDLQRVLTTMQRIRPAWFASYIERPLAAKELPVASAPEDDGRDECPEAARMRAESEEARLAAAAIEAIDSGLAAGRDPDELVPAVVRALFVEQPDCWLGSVLADEQALSDLVRRILSVVRRVEGGGG